jgi:mono/diheme cytochrome c family protein
MERISMKRWVVLTTIVVGLGVIGSLTRVPAAQGQEAAAQERLQRLPQQVTPQTGQQLYRQACAPCHGIRGDGQGPAARGLEPKPHNFTQGAFKFRTTRADAMPTDADIFRTISEGIAGTAMPAWKRLLSAQQRLTLVQYIKTFDAEKFAAAAQAPPQPIRVPSAPRTTSASVAQGKQIYERLQCWQCHGRSGDGDGPLAAVLRDASNRPIRPQDFTRGVYKSGQQPEDLLRTVLTGLSGTPMPGYASSLSIEEGWHLVHYVRSLARPKTLWYYLFVDTAEHFPGR